MQSFSFQIGDRLQAAQTLDFLGLTKDKLNLDCQLSTDYWQLIKLTDKRGPLIFVWLDSKWAPHLSRKTNLNQKDRFSFRARMIDSCQLNRRPDFSGSKHTTSKINHKKRALRFGWPEFSGLSKKVQSFSFEIAGGLEAAQTLDFLGLTNRGFKIACLFSPRKSQLMKLTIRNDLLTFVWMNSKRKARF